MLYVGDDRQSLSATISPGPQAVAGTVRRMVNDERAVAAAPPGVHTSLAVGVAPLTLLPVEC